MCQNCGTPSCNPCPCTNTGDLSKWDFSSIIYHKDNNEVTELDGLGLANGVTLEAVIESLDEYIKQIKVNTWDLPYLEDTYAINTLQQFAGAVDTELAKLNRFKGDVTADPVGTSDGDYWYRTDTSALKIKVNGTIKTITTT